MSPFKKTAVKGGGSKGKEPVIEVDDFSSKTKRTRSPLGVFDPNKFRSYAAFPTHENYFRNATPLLERPVDHFHFMTLKFHNGLLTRIGIIFSPIWMKLMRIW